MGITASKVRAAMPPAVTNSIWLTKTTSPGSATETKNPKRPPAKRNSQSLSVFTREVPVTWPKGEMPISTPTKKMERPTIKAT